MKVTHATFADHRAALLEAAGRLFRARGLDRVSIGEISRSAGLTHGAFYGHYVSKEALAAESCRRSLQDSAERWRARAAAAPGDPLGAIVDHYLTERHRDEPAEDGCALASLGPEVARGGDAVASGLNEGARGLLDVLEECLARTAPERDAGARAEIATGLLALLTGGILLARALRPDPARSTRALAAARRAARRLIEQPHA